MPKLKSLRGAVGVYGRVAANGIVDVSEDLADKLLKTKRFVRATDADIAAAQDRQQKELAVETAGATPGFSALPAPPATTDRLSEMIERGQIDPVKARELVALQINLSPEEIHNFIKAETEKVLAEIAAAQAILDEHEAALTERENGLARKEADLAAAQVALDDRERVLSEREAEIAAATEAAPGGDAEAAQSEATAKGKATGKAQK